MQEPEKIMAVRALDVLHTKDSHNEFNYVKNFTEVTFTTCRR